MWIHSYKSVRYERMEGREMKRDRNRRDIVEER